MPWQRCEIRWAKPAIEAFLSKYGPEDADAVNGILIQVRNHPDDIRMRKLIDPKKLRSEIESVEGDVYCSTDEIWEVYYNWSPEHMIVVLAEKRGPASKR